MRLIKAPGTCCEATRLHGHGMATLCRFAWKPNRIIYSEKFKLSTSLEFVVELIECSARSEAKPTSRSMYSHSGFHFSNFWLRLPRFA